MYLKMMTGSRDGGRGAMAHGGADTLYRLALDIRGLLIIFTWLPNQKPSATLSGTTVIFLGMQWVLSATKNVFSRSSSRQRLAPSLVAASVGFHVHQSPHS